MGIFDAIFNKRKYKVDAEEKGVIGGAFFECPGAGHLFVGPHAHAACGKHVGFSIGVSWGSNGYLGGVIGRDEAKRLANYILEKCEGITETETEEYFRRYPTQKP